MVPPGTHSASSSGRRSCAPRRIPWRHSRSTRSGSMARPVDKHRAGPACGDSRRRWGNVASCSRPSAATTGCIGRRCSATWLSRAGETPAGRGGNDQRRSWPGPWSSRSASARAVRRREAAVAPAAEMPSRSAVRVAASSSNRSKLESRWHHGSRWACNCCRLQRLPTLEQPNGRPSRSERVKGNKSVQELWWLWDWGVEAGKNPVRQRVE